jgi:FkbM family methyltransferase
LSLLSGQSGATRCNALLSKIKHQQTKAPQPITKGSRAMKDSVCYKRNIGSQLKSFLRPVIFCAKNYSSAIRRLLISSNVTALAVETEQGFFLIDPEDTGVGGELIEKKAYGKDEIARILSFTDAASNVLFVGAHIGSLAIPVSKKVSQVTAIEANPNTFKLLTANIALNSCANINAIHMAASNKKEELEFVISKVNSGGSKRMPVNKKHMYFYDHPSITKVNADRLDTVIPGKYNVIVMDIEGSEYFALMGMQKILSKTDHLIIEFLPHHLKNVADVSVLEFLTTIEPYFSALNVPSKKLTVFKTAFLLTLQTMYNQNEEDDGIVFSKS